MKTIVLKLTSAIVVGGQIVTAGSLVEVTEGEAKNLLARGKAVPATASDERAPAASSLVRDDAPLNPEVAAFNADQAAIRNDNATDADAQATEADAKADDTAEEAAPEAQADDAQATEARAQAADSKTSKPRRR